MNRRIDIEFCLHYYWTLTDNEVVYSFDKIQLEQWINRGDKEYDRFAFQDVYSEVVIGDGENSPPGSDFIAFEVDGLGVMIFDRRMRLEKND